MTAPLHIHWVSPLPPARTDIAEYTRRVLPHLAERARVTLWTDAAVWDEGLATLGAPGRIAVRRFDPAAPLPLPPEALTGPTGEEAAWFFHIGNSWEFHSGILALARRVPGVVVLHDLALREALRDMVANGRLPRPAVLETAAAWYGAAARSRAAALLDGAPIAPEALAEEPLWEVVLARASAVLCHTGPALRTVAARRCVPAYRLELPFPAAPLAPVAPPADGPLRLVQFGHIGPNRRIEQVFEAMARVLPGVDAVLDVYGRLWDERHLRARADALGLGRRVRLHGFAPEAALDAAIASAHCVTNLRQPSMGEASGSQLRIWNASALGIVTDLGWYAELPEETVVKLPADDEAEALARLLRRLDADRGLAARIGAAGRARLEAAHDPAAYAEGIAAIASCAGRDAAERLSADRLGLAARRCASHGARATPQQHLVRARLAARLGN